MIRYLRASCLVIAYELLSFILRQFACKKVCRVATISRPLDCMACIVCWSYSTARQRGATTASSSPPTRKFRTFMLLPYKFFLPSRNCQMSQNLHAESMVASANSMEAVLPVVGSETCKCCALRLDNLLIMQCSSSVGGNPHSIAQRNNRHHRDHCLFMPSPCLTAYSNIWSIAISLAALKHRNSTSHVTSKKRANNMR